MKASQINFLSISISGLLFISKGGNKTAEVLGAFLCILVLMYYMLAFFASASAGIEILARCRAKDLQSKTKILDLESLFIKKSITVRSRVFVSRGTSQTVGSQIKVNNLNGPKSSVSTVAPCWLVWKYAFLFDKQQVLSTKLEAWMPSISILKDALLGLNFTLLMWHPYGQVAIGLVLESIFGLLQAKILFKVFRLNRHHRVYVGHVFSFSLQVVFIIYYCVKLKTLQTGLSEQYRQENMGLLMKILLKVIIYFPLGYILYSVGLYGIDFRARRKLKLKKKVFQGNTNRAEILRLHSISSTRLGSPKKAISPLKIRKNKILKMDGQLKGKSTPKSTVVGSITPSRR